MNELTIQLENKGKTPLYEQIYQYIREEIRKGKMERGEKLPSTRLLSAHLDISRSTVELAYEQLLSEGYIETIPCKGYYVADINGIYQLDLLLGDSRNFVEKNQEDVSLEKEGIDDLYLYDFTPYGVDTKCFPDKIWRKLSKEILARKEEDLFLLGNGQGEEKLRFEISRYLYQSRGVNCGPEQIIIGAGNDYLLMLLSMILGTDRVVAFENPTYKQAYHLFENLSYRVQTVDMDKNGMDISQLKETGADVAYVMPSHQYPLGIVMPVKRRLELLSWAGEKENRYIIEDDYDSEFRYKGKPIPALQGYDKQGKVIYLGTFSKSIAPAIRMSYMVLPDSLCKLYLQKGKFMNSTVSRVDQLMVAEFLGTGAYERHLNKARALYKSRHDILLKALRPLQNVCRISGEQAGVHLILTFINGVTEEELIARAKQKKIRVYGLSAYETKPQTLNSSIILGYATLSEEQILEAMAILTRIWL